METLAKDSMSARILEELVNDARLTWREIGERVHLSPTSVAERVRSMERDGLIRGYHTSVDPAAFGRTVRAIVDVGLPPTMNPEMFEQRLVERDEVAFATYITGRFDYMVIVDCAGADGLDSFLRWLKSSVGVARTESKLVLRTLRGERRPSNHLS